MKNDKVFINDPIHGFLEMNPLQVELLHLPEIQRLQWIKQLGLSFLAFPGATHTRLSHALGVSYLAGEMGRSLELSGPRISALQAAGILHDVGHTPFSHTLEFLLPIDHMELTRRIITGEEVMSLPAAGGIPAVLESFGLDPGEVGDLVTSKHGDRVLQGIIHGQIDADQLDFLARDAYFCGIPHGHVDIRRIIHTMRRGDGGEGILFLEKGIDALEEALIARDHMYSAVYTHKIARIAEIMLLRAMTYSLEDIPDFTSFIDGELLTRLQESGAVSRMLAGRVIFRNLYKTAYSVSSIEPEGVRARIGELFGEKEENEIERWLTSELNLETGSVIVDFPTRVLSRTEPRMKRLDIPILMKDGEIKPLDTISPLIKALERKVSTHLVLGIYSEESLMERVRDFIEGYVGKRG